MANFLDLASLAQTINFFIQFLTKSIIYYLWTSRPDFLGLAGYLEAFISLFKSFSNLSFTLSGSPGPDLLDLVGLPETIHFSIRFLVDYLISYLQASKSRFLDLASLPETTSKAMIWIHLPRVWARRPPPELKSFKMMFLFVSLKECWPFIGVPLVFVRTR